MHSGSRSTEENVCSKKITSQQRKRSLKHLCCTSKKIKYIETGIKNFMAKTIFGVQYFAKAKGRFWEQDSDAETMSILAWRKMTRTCWMEKFEDMSGNINVLLKMFLKDVESICVIMQPTIGNVFIITTKIKLL